MNEARVLNFAEPAYKSETHYLWWVDLKTGKRLSAGVAFYDQKFNEYRLKLDIFPEQQYYLRTVGVVEDSVIYRVEVIHKKNGKFSSRRMVGDGISSTTYSSEILMNLGPFTKKLALNITGEAY